MTPASPTPSLAFDMSAGTCVFTATSLAALRPARDMSPGTYDFAAASLVGLRSFHGMFYRTCLHDHAPEAAC